MAQPEIHRKVGNDAADRCISTNGKGQCNNVKVPGCDHCMIHGGGHQNKKNLAEGVKNYRLGIFKGRVDEFADSPQVKSLREEVGITRLVLEEIVNMCKDQTDLLLYSEKIGKMITQVKDLVLACQKLEEKSGSMLDKTQLFVICEAIVKIIGEHVTDPDDLDIISQKISDTLTKSIAVNPLS